MCFLLLVLILFTVWPQRSSITQECSARNTTSHHHNGYIASNHITPHYITSHCITSITVRSSRAHSFPLNTRRPSHPYTVYTTQTQRTTKNDGVPHEHHRLPLTPSFSSFCSLTWGLLPFQINSTQTPQTFFLFPPLLCSLTWRLLPFQINTSTTDFLPLPSTPNLETSSFSNQLNTSTTDFLPLPSTPLFFNLETSSFSNQLKGDIVESCIRTTLEQIRMSSNKVTNASE
jgi:hypothetical protein